MSGLIDARKGEVTVLPGLAAAVERSHLEGCVAGSTEGVAELVVDVE